MNVLSEKKIITGALQYSRTRDEKEREKDGARVEKQEATKLFAEQRKAR